MQNRVIKPGDTHLMEPNEEYNRIVYERLWNQTDVFSLSVEVFDRGGIRTRRTFNKLHAGDEYDILARLLGEGWETVFAQDYQDWAIRCQKRQRATPVPMLPFAANKGLRRSVVWGAAGVCGALLLLGWIIGRLSLPRDESLEIAAGDPTESAVDPDTASDVDELGEVDAADLNEGSEANPDFIPGLDEDLAPDLSNDSPFSPASGDEASGALDGALDNDDDAETAEAELDDDSESPTNDPSENNPSERDTSDAPLAIAPTAANDAFLQAVRIAQAAVIGGREAETAEEWEELAEQWQQAADLMATVPENDENYDVAQDRVEMYENNVDIALSEAEKAGDN